MYQRIVNFGSQLIEPHPSIESAYDRRQAALLMSLLVILVMIFTAAYLTPYVLQLYEYDVVDIFVGAAFLLCTIPSYFLARSGHYRIGAGFVAAALVLLIWTEALLSETQTIAFALYYQIVAIGIVGVFMSLQAGAVALFLILGGTVVVGQLADHIPFGSLPIFFLVTASTLLLVVFRHNHLLEKESRAVLAESEEKYRTIFEASSDAMFVHEDGIVREVNDSLEQLTGLRRDDVIGKSILDFASLEAQKMIQRSMQEGAGRTFEVPMFNKDREILQIQVSIEEFRVQGKAMRVVTMRNIGEERKAQEQALALELERQKVRLMQQFISDVSHDLRTPLTVLNTSLHLLKQTDDGLSRHQRIDMMSKQIARLTGMIDDLMTVNRLDKTAKGGVSLKLGDLNALVVAICHEQEIFAQSESVEFSWQVDEHLPHVLIDEDELKRAVRQLVTNAIHYTPAQGSVTAQTYTQDRHAVVEVQDTGIGIHPEDQGRIFDLFYRADAARGTDKGGMGLGLSITKRIVEAHGGKIEVESAAGEGSTFRIVLPTVTLYEGVGVRM